MVHPKTSRSFAAFCLAAVALTCACDTDGTLEIVDAGPSDAGQLGGRDTILRAVDWPADARRGPVLLTVDLVDPDGSVTAVRVEREAGGAWVPATTLWHEREGNRLRWAWDSFADQPSTGLANVRFVATDPEDGDVTLDLSLELSNDPEVDRLVLVSHPYTETAGVRGQEISAWVWDGLSPGLLASSNRVQVGLNPGVIRAAPHGRAAAVDITEFQQWGIDIVRTPLDALVDGVEVTHTLELPYSVAAAFAWSHDGRYLWVAGGLSNNPPLPPVLWRYEPSEDLSVWPDPVAVTELPGPPGALAVDPLTGRVLVHCGKGGGEVDHLVLYDRHGEEIGRLSQDLGPTQGMGISSDGQYALWAPNPFSNYAGKLLLFSLESGVAMVGEPVDFTNGYEPWFHPDRGSHAALVSSFESNAVTPVRHQAGAVSVGSPITGLPLAAEMDRIERGSQSGTFLLPVTSSPTTLRAVMLNTDGTAHRIEFSAPLGAGFEAMSGGIAIQR